MNKKITLLLIVSIFILLLPQYLFARYRVEFTPSVSLNEMYDDNIYLDRTNEQSDWLTSLSLDLNLNITSKRNNFSIQYSPTPIRYKDEDNNNTIRHKGSFSFSESLSQHLQFELSDTYIRSEEPIEETADIIGVRRTRNTYQRNNWDSSINYNFGPSNSILFGYTHSLLENEDVTLDDGTIFDPYANITYWVNTKNGIEFSSSYTVADFSRDDDGIPGDDYSGYNGSLTYLYNFSQHLTASADYGISLRNFKGISEDYFVHEANIGFIQQLSTNLSFSLSGGYFVQKPDNSDDNNGYMFDLSLSKSFDRGDFLINISSGWNEAYLESERRGFTDFQSLTSSFNYQVTENINNYASISYRQNRDETNRKSKTIGVNYGWGWTFLRDYSMSLDYSCLTRDDDLNTNDYMVNRVNLIIKWSKPYR